MTYYDHCTGMMLTGDTLLAGYLLVFDSQPDYVASIARLHDFSLKNPVSHIAGGHVEMTSTPGVPFPTGATYQPGEHVLQLGVEHLRELHTALQLMGLPLFAWQFDDYKLEPF